MAYPGNTELSPQAQDRVMTAFKQVVEKLQQGNREEALIGLEFVLRLDPAYAPAKNLHQQLSSGAEEVDLNEIISQLEAPTTDTINMLVVEAVEDFNNRDYDAARAKVEQVLMDLPGHEEARTLLAQIDDASSGSSQVEQFLAQARDALGNGNTQEAANFVMMAQALDPHHEMIAATLAEIEEHGGISMEDAGFVADPSATQKIDFEEMEGQSAPEFDAAGAADLFSDAGSSEDPTVVEPDVPDFEPPAPPEPAPSQPPAGEEAGAAGEQYYESRPDDVAELFDTGPTTFSDGSPDAAADSSSSAAAVQELLAAGGAAAAKDNYVEAIDTWSRVLLLDPTNEEALDRITHIRHAKDELEARIAPMLVDANAAFESGDGEIAHDFVKRVLSLWPKHVEATQLKEKLDLGAPPKKAAPDAAESAPEMPDLEDDLFTDDFTATTDFGAAVPRRAQALEGEWRTPQKPKRRIPWQWWVAIGAGGLVLVTISLWMAGAFAPEAPPESRFKVVNRVLIEAAELYNTKKIDEAIVLLEENSAEDAFQVRIDKRLAEYRKMVATPVPTPIPEGLAACRTLAAEGRWITAYSRVMDELQIAPNDPPLEEVRQQIVDAEPEAADYYRAVVSGDYRAALLVVRGLYESRPDDPELPPVYDRSLFNAGLAELRAFNLPAAEVHLKELTERSPGDEEVGRMLEFIELYKARPVDMQLEIFVGSINTR